MLLWNDVLAHVRPPARSQRLQDLASLEFSSVSFKTNSMLFKTTVGAPIHSATWYGHVEVARSLLQKHDDVNMEHGRVEMMPHGYTDRMTGRTALDMAILRSKAIGLPDEVKRGGYEEIRCWKEDMQSIIQISLKGGARSGSEASVANQIEALALELPGLSFPA